MAQDPLIRAALDCGADKAVLIGQDAIVTDPVFRSLCEANRCGAYGRCWMCPPAVGPVVHHSIKFFFNSFHITP